MNRELLRAYARKMGPRVTHRDAHREIVRVLTQIAHLVSFNTGLVFGYHDREDIEQQGILEALEVLEKGPADGPDDHSRYDVNRPLENFLRTHITNRLKNLKRDTFYRWEAPCPCCDTQRTPENPCRKWTEWSERNARKQSLMNPLNVHRAPEHAVARDGHAEDELALKELKDRIDRELEAGLRSDYLRAVAGEKLPDARLARLRNRVAAIIDNKEAGHGQAS